MTREEAASRRGPVVLRGKLADTATEDQALLRPPRGDDWQRHDPWRVLRIQSEFVTGFDSLARVGPAISVFGSARTRPDTAEYREARAIGAGLARAGYAVITGGGPGAMEAAGRGAHEAGGLAVGLGIEL
ncbi:MAG: TIGR00730 family Rossman fold protein, partial [Bifidobacteriaceae bacterium]|nr:TIGR00730 family Rossman fold protein [Bifidobacteriaceae bacterium]